jgi:hypothetical protein
MMPASEHETAGVLSRAEIQQFIQDGFVRIDRAFPRQLADEGRASCGAIYHANRTIRRAGHGLSSGLVITITSRSIGR